MTFIIADLGADIPDLVLRNSEWGPIARMISESGLLDPKRSETIEYNLAAQVTANEAEKIAVRLSMYMEVVDLPKTSNAADYRRS